MELRGSPLFIYVLHTISQSSFFFIFIFFGLCSAHNQSFVFFIVNPQASENSWGRSYFGRKQFAKFRSQRRRSKSKLFMLKSCLMLTKIPRATSICNKKILNMLSWGQNVFLMCNHHCFVVIRYWYYPWQATKRELDYDGKIKKLEKEYTEVC